MISIGFYMLIAFFCYLALLAIDQYVLDLHAEDPTTRPDSACAAVTMGSALIWPLTLSVAVIAGVCCLSAYLAHTYGGKVLGVIHLFMGRMLVRCVNATLAFYKWARAKYRDWKAPVSTSPPIEAPVEEAPPGDIFAAGTA